MDRDNIQYKPVPPDEPVSSDEAEDEPASSDEEGGCFNNLKGLLWNLYRFFFTGYLPDNLYTTDFRLFFILTAIYTSLVLQFRQTGIREAEDDVDSGRRFRINSDWTNHSISGGVSDQILWNCRADSQTDTYYKTVYFGMILIYCTVVVVYLIASFIINTMVACAVSTLKIHKRDNLDVTREVLPYYLETVADNIKISHQVREMLKSLQRKLLKEENEQRLQEEVHNAKTRYNKLLKYKEDKTTHFYNWLTVLYIIPRFESVIMLSILTLALTSYDVHPIGCLSSIGVSYNETESSVTLMFSKNVTRYQKVSVVLIASLAFVLLLLKLFQFVLLPRSKWGIQIKKLKKGNYCCWYCCCTFGITRSNNPASRYVPLPLQTDKNVRSYGAVSYNTEEQLPN